MLSVELKINGKTIGTIEATRRSELDDGDTARYWTHMHHDQIDGVYVGRTRFVTHSPADGAWELVRKIIEDPRLPDVEPWHGKAADSEVGL